MIDEVKTGTIQHKPRVSVEPFIFTCETVGKEIQVVAMDAIGRKAGSEIFKV